MKLYQKSYDWDCYNDKQEEDWYHNWLGITIKGVFLGFHWLTFKDKK